MYSENPLIQPSVTDTLENIARTADNLKLIIEPLAKRDKSMGPMFDSALSKYSYHLNNLEGALNYCHREAPEGRITKPRVTKNPFILLSAKGMLSKMAKALGELKKIHVDISGRPDDKKTFTQREVTKFCTTLDNVKGAAQHYIDKLG